MKILHDCNWVRVPLFCRRGWGKSWIREEEPVLPVAIGRRLIGRMLATTDDLAERLAAIEENPLRFPKLETLPGDQPCRRALLTTFRYAVVFEVLDNTIVVVAVAHTGHAPNYWLDR